MIVGLLYAEGRPAGSSRPDPEAEDRFQDLELSHLLGAMARGDELVEKVCRRELDRPLESWDQIRYRQAVLRDCMEDPQRIRDLYDLCGQAEEERRNCWYRLNSPHLSTVYSSGLDLLEIYLKALVKIRNRLEGESFQSEGLSRFARLLRETLSDPYLQQVKTLYQSLSDEGGTLISAGFGPELQGVSYVLRKKETGSARLKWLLAPAFTIGERDQTGVKDLDVRRDRAINEAANALAQAAGNLEAFTEELRQEAAFYVGALNLRDRLREIPMPVCFPEPPEEDGRYWQELYDGSLAVHTGKPVTGNSLGTENRGLCLITGANQGGKTTFLRSVGQCQVMAQCGLFVCAQSCRLPVKDPIFTHFKREEDETMGSGKLDEELERMSGMVSRLRPGSLILFNESFSSTNEREGSEIFRQITQALMERKVEIFSVTHLLTYALEFAGRPGVLCLKAQRRENGERTFRMVPGSPEETAYGEDLFREIFGKE